MFSRVHSEFFPRANSEFHASLSCWYCTILYNTIVGSGRGKAFLGTAKEIGAGRGCGLALRAHASAARGGKLRATCAPRGWVGGGAEKGSALSAGWAPWRPRWRTSTVVSVAAGGAPRPRSRLPADRRVVASATVTGDCGLDAGRWVMFESELHGLHLGLPSIVACFISRPQWRTRPSG